MIGTGTRSVFLAHVQLVVVTVGVATPGLQFACGPHDPTLPTPNPQAPVDGQNPCPAEFTSPSASFRADFGTASPLGDGQSVGSLHGRARRTILDAVWEHRIGLERGLILPTIRRAAAEDVGEIAVLQDEGDLILAANSYDLRDVTLRFEPNAAGGYDVTRVGSAAYRPLLGDQVMLGDDDSAALALFFEYPFYGRVHIGAFVNSDGNITFEEGDDASTLRDISRLLTGPSRVAPFLADLDPSAAGANFFVDSDASVMGGNDIEELGGGRFETVSAVERYSALDQYVMGLRHDFEVPPFFHVESPLNDRRRAGTPEVRGSASRSAARGATC